VELILDTGMERASQFLPILNLLTALIFRRNTISTFVYQKQTDGNNNKKRDIPRKNPESFKTSKSQNKKP
jgi:hypothetical protein